MDGATYFKPVQVLRQRLASVEVYVKAVLCTAALVCYASEVEPPWDIARVAAILLDAETRPPIQWSGRTPTHRAVMTTTPLRHPTSPSTRNQPFSPIFNSPEPQSIHFSSRSTSRIASPARASWLCHFQLFVSSTYNNSPGETVLSMESRAPWKDCECSNWGESVQQLRCCRYPIRRLHRHLLVGRESGRTDCKTPSEIRLP